MNKAWLWVVSAIAVIVIYHTCYGLVTIIPTNISWLMTAMHDWGTHYLGWLFYKNEAWQFPIGNISNYYFPIGTNIGFTDSIPLMAIFFKLFAPILPEDFQYFGLWLFLCHALAAYYTILIFRLLKFPAIYTLLAVIFVTANPVLVYRGLHPALCAHWLLLASLYLYFRSSSDFEPKKTLLYQYFLLIISALINPYLCCMMVGFTGIIAWKIFFFDKGVRKIYFFPYLLISSVSLMLIWYLIGMISFGKKENLGVEGGYGLYSLNLNSLYNPGGFSSLLPGLKQVSWHQYEGFMYLGMGIFLLLLVLLIYYVSNFFTTPTNNKAKAFGLSLSKARLIPILILFCLFSLFSITHIISLNDKILLQIPAPGQMRRIGEIFRASARFFWPVYYMILLISLSGIIASRMKPGLKVTILLLAIVVQLYDIRPLLTHRNLSYGSYSPPIDTANWNGIIREFDDIILYPPFQATYLTNLDYQYFSYLAAKAGKPINTGYVARSDIDAVRLYNDSLRAELLKGKISPQSLYITTSAHLNYYALPLQAEVIQVNTLDDYYYLFAGNANSKKLQIISNRLNNENKEKLDSVYNVIRKKIEFVQTGRIEASKKEQIVFNIENIDDEEKYLYVNGWAFIENKDKNKGDSVFFFLNSSEQSYIAKTTIFKRPDITAHFKKSYLDDAGFEAIIYKDSVKNGKYSLGIVIKNVHGDLVYQSTDRIVNVGIAEYALAEKISELPDMGKINYGIDSFEADTNFVKIGGWAAFENRHADSCEISLLFSGTKENYESITEQILRPDVTAHFGNKFSLDKSGFAVKLLKESLPKGKYKLGIRIKDKRNQKEAFVFTGREVDL